MCSHCGGLYPTDKHFKQQRNEKGYKKTPFNPQNFNNNSNECNDRKPNTCFRCGSEDHFIANCPKPDTLNKKFHWNTENPKTRVYRSKRVTGDIWVYGIYVFQCRNSWKIFWRQIATDQLDFRLRCDLSHDTRYLRFYTSLIGENR